MTEQDPNDDVMGLEVRLREVGMQCVKFALDHSAGDMNMRELSPEEKTAWEGLLIAQNEAGNALAAAREARSSS